MFKGFNMTITSKEKKQLIDEYHSYGENLYKETETNVKKELDSYIGLDGHMDCSKLITDWFPALKNQHIFLSHSHDDKKLAVSLAGYLHEQYGLNTFIDSCIWGYSNILLRTINEHCCKSTDNITFDYDKVSLSTTHIHAMLSTALNTMIDLTECVIFLNTDKSIVKTEDVISSKTESAWIYSELITTSLIRQNRPMRYINKSFSLTETAELNNFKPIYDADLKHLIILSFKDFENISSTFNEPELTLDKLYLNKINIPRVINE